MRHVSLALVFLAMGCTPPESTPVGGPSADDISHEPDTGTPETDTDTGAPPTAPLAVTAGSWRLHASFESVAYVSWEQSAAAPAWVEYSVDKGEWRSSPRFDARIGRNEQLLVGLPFDHGVPWRVVVEDGEDRVVVDGKTLLTGPLPKGLPTGVVTASASDTWEPTGHYLLSSISERTGSWPMGPYWTFIVDRQGRPVWAQITPNRAFTLFAHTSDHGDYILWDESTYWSDFGDGAGTLIHKTWLDTEIEQIPADGLVHGFVELADGAFLYGSEWHEQRNETLVELPAGAKSAKEARIIWTCDEDYPGRPSAWCSTNGIFYNASTDSVLLSFWDESVVVDIDRQSGENIWWAGGVPTGYAFDPIESQYNFQHGVSYTDAGTLLVHSINARPMAREYEVDHKAMTLREVWSYGEEQNHQGVLNGDVWRLPGGNTLHTLGSAGEVNEVAPDGEVVWNLDFQQPRLMGRSGWIPDLYALVSPRE